MFRARADGKIPVIAGPRLVELAGPERLQRLMQAANVKIIRRRKTGAIVEIHLLEHGDDNRTPSRWANPQKLSHNHETPDNPAGVWMLKKLPGVAQRLGPARALELASGAIAD